MKRWWGGTVVPGLLFFLGYWHGKKTQNENLIPAIEGLLDYGVRQSDGYLIGYTGKMLRIIQGERPDKL